MSACKDDPREPLEHLMLRIGHGDQQAFGDLYDRTAAQVLSVVSRIVSDGAAAEEVVRDVFVAVWQSAPRRERYRGWVTSWILVMAHRCALDHIRAKAQ